MSSTTYRFKFNKDLFNNIREFSKLHSHDTCDDFMESFNLWIVKNKELIQSENSRLIKLGFKGDINNKIYKSARYYFKNKSKKSTQNKEGNIDSRRTEYVPRNPAFFKLIENYIVNNPIKASTLFKQFIDDENENIQTQISREIRRLFTFSLNKEASIKKIHKTFNNAYYKIKNKKNSVNQ
jgi:hypothetical protein